MEKRKRIGRFWLVCFSLAFFISLAVVVPAQTAHASTYGEQVAAQTAARLKNIDYKNNATILQLLAPSTYTSPEKYDKRTEIAKRDGKTILQVSDEEVLAELKKDYIVMAYGQSFENVQGDIERIIQRIVDNLIDSSVANEPVSTLQNNPEKILAGLVYLDRMYNFNMGGKNIRDVLIYTPNVYSKAMTRNQLGWLLQIGGAGAENLRISKNANMFGYNKVFTNNITNATSLADFLEENRRLFMPSVVLDVWFVQTSPALIEQRGLSQMQELYSRLWADSSLRNYILPLLTVSENSVYVIANPATITYGIVDSYVDRGLKTSNPSLYQTKMTQFRQTLSQAANQQYQFIELWRRLGRSGADNLLSTNRIVIDSLLFYTEDPYANPDNLWSARCGSRASAGVQEFIAPMGMYVNLTFADGEAVGDGVRMYLAKALTERGLTTYDHELTHQLVSTLILDQNGIRDGMGAEIYTRGTFETYESNDPPAFNLNFIYDRSNRADRFHNATPSRFQTVRDLQVYMNGILDVVYTLDYAEANAILGKSAADKQKWFHKLSQIDDTGNRSNKGSGNYTHKLDQVGDLSAAEAGELNSVDDLIEHGIIAARYEVEGTNTKGTVASNGYYVVPLFSANYAAVQNGQGVSGDLMIRRQAFELLAEYGYYGGMVPYISNQYKVSAANDNVVLSDTYILNKIFGSTYNSMTDFKKAMFHRRIDRVDRLQPVTITWNGRTVQIEDFETLNQLMEAAVENDLRTNFITSGSAYNVRAQNTQVELLKAEVYRAYLQQTNDFRKSIYTDGQILPDTAMKDNTGIHAVVFCIFMVLTLCVYKRKRVYDENR